MSLASSPDCLFRPEDKTLQMLFPSVEEGDNFDEFINEDLYGFSQQEDNSGSAEDVFSGDAFMSDYPRLPSLAGSTGQQQSPPQPWRKGLWCLGQTQTSRLAIEKTRKPGCGTISTAHLVNNDNLAIRASRSPVLSPLLKTTKRFATSPNAVKYRHKATVPIPISRDATVSPNPMYGQIPYHAKMEQVERWQQEEDWQQDFRNFSIRAPQQVPSASSRSPNRVQNGETARQINANMVAHNAAIGIAMSTYETWPNFRGDDGGGHGIIDPSLHCGATIDAASSPTGHGNSIMHQSFQPYRPTPTWTSESLHSSDSSHNSYATTHHSIHSGQSAYSNNEISSGQGQNWWSPSVDPNKIKWSNGRPQGYPTLMAPAPQRAPAAGIIQNLDQPNGLGIDFPELQQMASAVYQGASNYYNEPASTRVPYSPLAGTNHHGIPPVPPLPFSPSHNFSNPEPFTTPRKLRAPPPGSRSASLSPTNTSNRVLRQRSPTRADHPHSHHRRKSLHKAGPIRDTAGEATSSDHMRARSRSSSKPPRTPRTPKTPTGGFQNVDFVNYTPKDSQKLLSDVAPSGSSKTRARREAEQRDKRKKLSEAAFKLVSSAGGDIEALKREIFT